MMEFFGPKIFAWFKLKIAQGLKNKSIQIFFGGHLVNIINHLSKKKIGWIYFLIIELLGQKIPS